MKTKPDTALLVMQRLAQAYRNQDIGADTIALYGELLADIAPPLLRAAVDQAIADSDFFPTVHRIRKAAVELKAQGEGIPSNGEAWEFVLAWMATSGDGRPETHSAVESAVRAVGGWTVLGQGNVDDRQWVRKRFLEAYLDVLDGMKREDGLVPSARRLVEGERQRGMQRIGPGEIGKAIEAGQAEDDGERETP